MSIISPIGRRSWKVRALYAVIYSILIAGSITMVYPFLLMISGSMKSHVDTKDFDVWPAYFSDDVWLYRKHMEGLFNEDIRNLQQIYGWDATSFEKLEPPATVDEERVTLYREFLRNEAVAFHAEAPGYFDTPNSKTIPAHLRGFKRFLKQRHGENIDDVNLALDADFAGWSSINVRPRRYLSRQILPVSTALDGAVKDYVAQSVPEAERYIYSLNGFYVHGYLKNRYGRTVAAYNQAHGAAYTSWDDVRLEPQVAADSADEDWIRFVREVVGLQFIRLNRNAEEGYRSYLQGKYPSIDYLNRDYASAYRSFDDVPFPEKLPELGASLTDWGHYIRGWVDPVSGKKYVAPIEALSLDSVDLRFRRFATAAGLQGRRTALPQADFHYLHFLDQRATLKHEFATRNYKAVSEYLIFHGRGVFNTVVYCLLAVLSALIINPMAAYAMSRYRLPATYLILLFMLCTMAFPPMVTAIPNFLMLRNLGLLNTFAALILPVMANGYAVFLLKGFFDSQPRELYESAQLDGAGEWVMFWQLTMRLSKPILAVIALQAFNLAYADFMFAFVVCQDERMWTLMVWLYQLQQRSGQAVVYASLMIAAIPTFLIFLFCQNIIMRGIVVPSEK